MSTSPLLEWSDGAAGPLLAGDGEDLAWQDQALCAQVDPELFFPSKGSGVRIPKRVCRVCPVRAECLDYAFENDLHHGVWGGTSEQERRRMRRGVAA
jgi:WhiB family redox-sensing transcriptional regulator